MQQPAQPTFHPGVIVRKHLNELHISHQKFARDIGENFDVINRLLRCRTVLTPRLALKISKSLGMTAESLMCLQVNYDLERVKGKIDLSSIRTYHVPDMVKKD